MVMLALALRLAPIPPSARLPTTLNTLAFRCGWPPFPHRLGFLAHALADLARCGWPPFPHRLGSEILEGARLRGCGWRPFPHRLG